MSLIAELPAQVGHSLCSALGLLIAFESGARGYPQLQNILEKKDANVSARVGNRSSVDESKSDGPEDETTVVEPDQGNGERSQ